MSNIAKAVFESNTKRHDQLGAKLQQPDRAGFVRLNAFLIDYKRYQQKQLARADDNVDFFFIFPVNSYDVLPS
jgi:hypothetical protein